MPTNFTVVPVEDSEDASNSAGAAEGSKPISLGKIFGEEVDEDNSEEPHSGRSTLQDKISASACRQGGQFLIPSYSCLGSWRSWSLSQHALG